MKYALIAVDTYQDPTKKLFTYSIPDNLTAKSGLGAKVRVPFGRRTVEGYIWEITDQKPPFLVKPIQEIKKQVFSNSQVKMAQWLSSYYLGSPLECLKCQESQNGEREATASLEEIKTLVLIPYASQVKIRAVVAQRKKERILIGSRSTVFAKLPALQKIVIEEPENWNYKEERAPYYHAFEVAKKRAQLENLKLELKPFNPSVELYAEGSAQLPKIKPISLIDLNLEKTAGNFTLVSQEVKKRLAQSQKTLIYTSSKVLQENIQEEIQKTGTDKGNFEIWGPEIFSLPVIEVPQIFWTDPDTLLNLPDFRSHEKLIWTAAKLSTLSKQPLCLQTSSPNHPVFKDLTKGDLDSFYQRELQNRKEFGYPPFGGLLLLSYSSKSPAKTSGEAEKLYADLLKVKELEVSPPYAPYAKKAGKHHLSIAVKVKNEKEEMTKKRISKLIPRGWKVDVDPESTI